MAAATTPLLADEQFKQFASQRTGGLPFKGMQAVLALQQEGATVPFIARYRKEKTGNLSEVEIRAIIDTAEEWQTIVQRKAFVIEEVGKQGNLTPELKRQLEGSFDLNEIEELYRPFKKKKKTKATLAREAGLGPLAEWLWAVGHGEAKEDADPAVKAKDFINAQAGFATYEEVLRGAQNILIERLSNELSLREKVRQEFAKNGKLVSTKGAKFKPKSKFETYADYSEPIKSLENKKASHRYLAVRRGWQEEELKVSIQVDEEGLLKLFQAAICTLSAGLVKPILDEVAKQALSVHVIPSITNEIHNRLKEKADLDAITVFAENVGRVLMASPFGPRVVLGVDPGIRTGCKIALVDRSGHFISNTVLHIEGETARGQAKTLFSELLKQVKLDAIAIGNGTGGREAEKFLREVLGEIGSEVPVIMVSEAGASVYSASEVAREEFPELDLTVRGAISIARRLQDPLSELVKVEPKSIGVGQYQHDVSQSKLKKSLHEVVESCVNQVGVDVNTASTSLLQYVAGIGPAIAKNIIEHRKKVGLFKDRTELSTVPQFSTKAFEQSAGFLRIPDSKTVLDRTGIHPERYQAVREMAQELGLPLTGLIGEGAKKLFPLREKWSQLIGEYTFDDIIKELEKPGRDPRDPFKVFKYRDDIHALKDLKEGMICPGLVTNVTNFGAFVDIGVHQDGLVHISELSYQFIDDPKKVVNPGDQVQVKVLAVDLDKSQISLTMKLEDRPKVASAPREPRPEKRAQGGGGGDRPRPSRQGRNVDRGGQRPEDSRPAPNRAASERPQKSGAAQSRPQQQRPQQKPFNNPFAALTNLKR